MGNQAGLVVSPSIAALAHPTGDCGVEVKTTGKKFYVNIAGAQVFGVSETSQGGWKGHTGFTGSELYKVSGGLRTSDNTATTILSIAIPSGKGIFARAFIGCKQVDESDAAAFTILASAVNAAGTVALKGTQNLVAVESDVNTTAVFDVSETGDVLRLRVTGVTGETWDWVGYVDYFLIDANT